MRRKVFVKRLNQAATENDLHQYFGQFGRLQKVEIKRNHLDNKSRRIAYVIFEKEEDATVCLLKEIHLMNGREIICKKCKNACEARKDKLNQSTYNDTIDSSRVVHSMTMSNESS